MSLFLTSSNSQQRANLPWDTLSTGENRIELKCFLNDSIWSDCLWEPFFYSKKILLNFSSKNHINAVWHTSENKSLTQVTQSLHLMMCTQCNGHPHVLILCTNNKRDNEMNRRKLSSLHYSNQHWITFLIKSSWLTLISYQIL